MSKDNNISGTYNDIPQEENVKPTFIITPEKIKAFEAEIIPYATLKVGFGLWDFGIKIPKKEGESPYSFFAGIYRNGFIDFLNYNGFFKRFRADGSYFLLRCVNNIIEEVEPINIADFITNFLRDEGTDIAFTHEEMDFNASLELQNETIKKQCHSIFNKLFLQLLPNFENEILRDTPTECYKLFLNGICKITSKGFEIIDYKNLENKCVWKNHIINFEFSYNEQFTTCHFYKFIRNVSNADADSDRYQAFVTGIGYLLHSYNAPQKGQAVIFYDEIITDLNKPEGGTGKGLLAKGLGKLSKLESIDGKKFDENNRFSLQRVTDSTQIVFFDDVKNKLGFDRFNSILTDGWNIEKKNKDEFFIKPEDSPKILITSNSILDCEGSTRKRRQFILEFSDFYSKHIKTGNEEPIKEIHCCIFFTSDWNSAEWQLFYSFMIYCILEFMREGLCNYDPINVISNRLRQSTNDDFSVWVETQKFELNTDHEVKPHYENFKNTYYDTDEKFSQRKFTSYLKKYATLNGLVFFQSPASNGVTYFNLKKN
jgi:hypothetical protein